MKVLVQRVTSANVKVNSKVVGEINRGLLLFVGFTQSDTAKEIDYMVDKVINLRIFDDENGVMNIKTDAAFNKLMSQFLERLQELDEKIDHFAVNELKDYLLG